MTTILPPPPPGHPTAGASPTSTSTSDILPAHSPPPSPTLSANIPNHREISTLASWTVSTYKPGCGVSALLSPSTHSFWQSDGPQPHLLNIHFFKLVSITKMRVYLDFELDESYTPTKMIFAAGMGEYDLVEFAEWKGECPSGWVDVSLEGCGGRRSSLTGDNMDRENENWEEEAVLRCMCVQIRVLENHQNGKDTHIRGVQLFARDERVRRLRGEQQETVRNEEVEVVRRGVDLLDWDEEPEIR